MNSQIPKSYNTTQNSPIYKEKPVMHYYPPPYQQVQHQYYSPPAALQGYAQSQSPFKQMDKKPKSKLSTKSPHAIAGHKLTRKNTEFIPSNFNREPMTNSTVNYRPNNELK